MVDKISEWLAQMTLEEKCKFLTGKSGLRSFDLPRLDIPGIKLTDGPHGIRPMGSWLIREIGIEGGAVCMPTASAMGSTWNRELVKLSASGIAQDCKQEDVDVLLGPGVNMKRTPVCGRNFEYFSEDPVLSGELSAAFIQGVQEEGVGTSLKHFALNNQEIMRESISVEVDERTLREYYLEAFRIAVEKGQPETIMIAYNKLCGIWCSENKWLLTELLRDEWNYQGLVVSDWGAVHDSAKALAAGMDLQMPCNSEIYQDILKGIENKIITEQDVQNACENVLKYIVKKVEDRTEKKEPNRKLQHQIAYQAASEAITLLKNEENILPIKPVEYKGIAVFGTYADKPVFMGGGSSHVAVSDESVDSPLECMKPFCAGKTELYYEPLYPLMIEGRAKREAIQVLADKTDLAIVFVASEPNMECECYDRNRIRFSDYINDCMEEILVRFSKVIVVMQTGACTIGTGWEESVQGLLQMWFAGESAGSAIADIMFGKVNPSGKLSETFMREIPKHLEHPGNGTYVNYSEGMNCGYRYYDKHPEEIWYPFGYGLSYTEFAYQELKVTPEISGNAKQKVTVSFKVQNIGDVMGKEAVQLYVEPVDSIAMRPIKELKEFAKIELQPGEKKTVTFELDEHAFSYYNPYLHEWHVESGRYKILIGASSRDIRLTGWYQVAYLGDYTINLKQGADNF